MQGSTATVVCATSDAIAVAWLGDSGAVLCRASPACPPPAPPFDAADEAEDEAADEADGDESRVPLRAQLLTRRHRPSCPDETARIVAAGGEVGYMTVTRDDGAESPVGPARAYAPHPSSGLGADSAPDEGDEGSSREAGVRAEISRAGSAAHRSDRIGGLAVSRAMGNLRLRPVVSGTPEAAAVERTGDEAFVIVATDGVLDSLAPDLACEIAHDVLEGWRFRSGAFGRPVAAAGPGDEPGRHGSAGPAGEAAAAAARALVAEALKRGSQDNASAAVLLLR